MTPADDLDTAPDPNPYPGNEHAGPSEAAPPPGQTERELRFELVTIRDRLTHDSAGGGYQQLPGQTRRRAALLKRERQIVAHLERLQPPLTLEDSPPDP